MDIVNAARENGSSTRFIILTSSTSYEDFLMAKKCNVEGYILKEALPEELLYAHAWSIAAGGDFDPQLLEYKLRQNENGFYEQLTPREREVL